MARIIKGDTVKLISGANKGTTGKVVGVNKDGILIEGIGQKHRHIKPSQLNPRGGHKDVHTPTPLHKVALVVDYTWMTGYKGMRCHTGLAVFCPCSPGRSNFGTGLTRFVRRQLQEEME